MPKTAEVKKTQKPRVEKQSKSDLFAVIATGGKQYKVAQGEKIKIEKIEGSFKEGDRMVFDQVLLVDDGSNTTIGDPYIGGAKVEGSLTKIGRYPTVTVIKYKQKSRYFKKNGHRQPYFEVTIDSIK